jgi:hypothetical protein
MQCSLELPGFRDHSPQSAPITTQELRIPGFVCCTYLVCPVLFAILFIPWGRLAVTQLEGWLVEVSQ